MKSDELRQKYLEFFKEQGHKIIPSASLIPENDSSTLFTSSGMQPLVPYLLGEKHPEGTRICDSQKSFRTVDIEEVGDSRHTTFFEMLGNWSLGDYFKKEQLSWIYSFLIDQVQLDPSRLYATVFRGAKEIGVPEDSESVKILKEIFSKYGIDAKDVDFSEKNGMRGGRIFYYPVEKNWWSRSGVPENMPVGEPGGPDSEIFYDLGPELKKHENSQWAEEPCHINCDCGRFIEIGNSVFMEYRKTEKGFEKLKQKNVDFGGGLERITMASQGVDNVFDTDLFKPIMDSIPEAPLKDKRIIADHFKASVFLISDGVLPSNKERGYFLRRLLRRAMAYSKINNFGEEGPIGLIKKVVEIYKDQYPDLEKNQQKIIDVIYEERKKFAETVDKGLKELEKMETLDSKLAFFLFQTFGLPFDIIKDLNPEKSKNLKQEDFEKELEKHQELSRTASAGMFKGGLADASEQTTRLHTATHLLLAGLRKVLGEDVFQKGANITAERIRFDFSHKEKMTSEQIRDVENFVNGIIEKDLPVWFEEMTLDEARKINAMGVFESKYGEKVKVYFVGKEDENVSKEICGGPHVEHTGILGKFKIQKEESSSSGVRRIKAVLE